MANIKLHQVTGEEEWEIFNYSLQKFVVVIMIFYTPRRPTLNSKCHTQHFLVLVGANQNSTELGQAVLFFQWYSHAYDSVVSKHSTSKPILLFFRR
jgi:hypothetical protein